MRILFAGNAGHIAAHTINMPGSQGYVVVTLDDWSAGFRDSVIAGWWPQIGVCHA